MARFQSSSLETSSFTNMASPPAARISSTTAPGRRAATTTLASSWAKSMAVPRPMPMVPPVTIATLPLSLPMDVLLSFVREQERRRAAGSPTESRPTLNRADTAGRSLPPSTIRGPRRRGLLSYPADLSVRGPTSSSSYTASEAGLTDLLPSHWRRRHCPGTSRSRQWKPREYPGLCRPRHQ